MNKNLFIVSSILLTSVLAAGIAFAQEATTAVEVPEEVRIDTSVGPEDLGVKSVGILPDSPWYVFKELGRGLAQIFTFNPVSKAELKLKFANEKIMEAKQLIEEKGTEKAINVAQNVIDEANRDLGSIANQGEQLKELKAKDAPRIEKFLDKVADHSLKQQVVLQKLQEQVSEEVFAKIETARQQHLENFVQVMTKAAENPQELAERLPKIIEAQKGSDFKEIKAIAILGELKEKAPEEAKSALKTAQETVVQKLEQRISDMPEEMRQEKLSNYVEFMLGDPIRQFEVLDVMKQNFKSPEMILETEILKDKAVKKIEKHIERIEDSAVLEKYKQQIQQNPNIKIEIERLAPTTINKIEQREQKLEQIRKQTDTSSGQQQNVPQNLKPEKPLLEKKPLLKEMPQSVGPQPKTGGTEIQEGLQIQTEQKMQPIQPMPFTPQTQ